MPREPASSYPTAAQPAAPRTERLRKPEPWFPANFPAYHSTQNMNEMAAYLANASYVVALGGPPLADLQYGVIIVPSGEESLLFGGSPDFVITQDFIDAISDANRDYDRALRMHDPDKDSEEFSRHRFGDDFLSVTPKADGMVKKRVVQSVQRDMQEQSQPEIQRPRQAPLPKASQPGPALAAPKKPGARKTAASPHGRVGRKEAPQPQRVAKPRRSPRLAGIKAGGGLSQAGAERARRGKRPGMRR